MARLEPVVDGLRLRLDPEEVRVVSTLAAGLAERLRGGADALSNDAVIDRLAPEVSRGDAAVDRELRAMLRSDLLATRSDRLDDLVTVLGRWSGPGGPIDHVLDRSEAMRLVEALNDVRLALAAMIGYEELVRDEVDDAHPSVDGVRLMDALAWLQGGLIDFVEGEA